MCLNISNCFVLIDNFVLENSDIFEGFEHWVVNCSERFPKIQLQPHINCGVREQNEDLECHVGVVTGDQIILVKFVNTYGVNYSNFLSIHLMCVPEHLPCVDEDEDRDREVSDSFVLSVRLSSFLENLGALFLFALSNYSLEHLDTVLVTP